MKTTLTQLDPADFIGPAPPETDDYDELAVEAASAPKAPVDGDADLAAEPLTEVADADGAADDDEVTVAEVAEGQATRVRYVGPRVKLEVEIGETDFEAEIDKAFRKLAGQVRVRGFRPGRAPRKVLENQLGLQAGRNAALEDAIPRLYADAVEEHGLAVVNQPDIELTAGATEGAVAFDATVEVRPVLELTGYDGLRLEVPNPAVPDEDIDERIDAMRKQGATLSPVERAAATGDSVTVSVSGTVEGTELPGLTAQGYVYEVGSGGIVPEFDPQVTGASAGDELEFSAPHPANPEAVIDFAVEVEAVSETVLPELADDWVADNSEHETVEALREALAGQLGFQRKLQANMVLRGQAEQQLAQLVEGPVPDSMTATVWTNRMSDVARQASSQNMSLQEWIERATPGPEEFFGQLAAEAEASVRVSLALEAIVNAEQFEITDEEVAEAREAAEVSADANSQPGARGGNKQAANRQQQGAPSDTDIRHWLATRKAMDLVLERAALVDPDGNTVNRDDLELTPPTPPTEPDAAAGEDHPTDEADAEAATADPTDTTAPQQESE